ncbi:uncharacterized protein LOC107313428 isoform X2 [Coturnix japonica]|nr:uncharacterized protein LOC107313428 isoform X2 [Coturnix japonica]XP_015717133.1 uncharacterized protein LOC107313428 isoform X2 [Coturnix japonica]
MDTLAYGTNISEKETLSVGMLEKVEQLEKECSVNRSWRNDCEARLQFLEKCCSIFSGRAIQKEAREKEECEKLKEKIRKLEARNQYLLSQAMSMHKQSENINDPLRLSAVLEMFKKLKLQEWGKCWNSSARWSYKTASIIIQKLFDACERDTEMRKTDICQTLGFPPPDYAANSYIQEQMCGQMLAILKLLRYSYYHNDSVICKIITHANVSPRNADQEQFAKTCCRVFCLLLLQDSPVKAVWDIRDCSLQHVELVDQQDIKYFKKSELQILWPLLMDGKIVIERGVAWNEK